MSIKGRILFYLLLFFAAVGLLVELISDPVNTVFMFVFAAIVIFLLYRFLSKPHKRPRPGAQTTTNFWKTSSTRKKRKSSLRVVEGKKKKSDESRTKYYH